MKQIRLGYNAVPAEAAKEIIKVFRSGQYSPGPRVREFEKAWAAVHGARHAIFVNSGTDALRLGLLALKEKHGWLDGDEVAVPALTFVATVNVILQVRLKPFFVDVGMYDYLINPWNLERRLGTNGTLRAVIPVHLFGRGCGKEIYDVSKKYGLKVLEDSCETILNPLLGEVSCYSTYMAHHVTTGVGGMALTDDDELMWLMRSYANHGRNTHYIPGYTTREMVCPSLFNSEDDFRRQQIKHRFQFDRVGYSCRGTEFEAVLGLSQMGGLKESVGKRREVASWLSEALSGLSDFQLPCKDLSAWMMFPIVIKESSKLKKHDVCLALERSGIETRDMMPVTNQPCYRGLMNENNFPVAGWINRCGFYIPCHPGMTRGEVDFIRKVLQNK